MDKLLDFLFEIEKRPPLFIGSKDIHHLSHFLTGYCMAKQEIDSGYGRWLLDDFRIFLANKYNDSRSFNWAMLIHENEENGDSTDAFFILLHEFLSSCAL